LLTENGVGFGPSESPPLPIGFQPATTPPRCQEASQPGILTFGVGISKNNIGLILTHKGKKKGSLEPHRSSLIGRLALPHLAIIAPPLIANLPGYQALGLLAPSTKDGFKYDESLTPPNGFAPVDTMVV